MLDTIINSFRYTEGKLFNLKIPHRIQVSKQKEGKKTIGRRRSIFQQGRDLIPCKNSLSKT